MSNDPQQPHGPGCGQIHHTAPAMHTENKEDTGYGRTARTQILLQTHPSFLCLLCGASLTAEVDRTVASASQTTRQEGKGKGRGKGSRRMQRRRRGDGQNVRCVGWCAPCPLFPQACPPSHPRSSRSLALAHAHACTPRRDKGCVGGCIADSKGVSFFAGQQGTPLRRSSHSSSRRCRPLPSSSAGTRRRFASCCH
jgi:hypothetical protein